MKLNKNELEEIYKMYAEPLFYYLVRLTGSPSLAEDLVQETFIKATIALSFYKDEHAKAWLFKVARHSYFDEWRKRKRWQLLPFVDQVFNKKEMVSPYGQPEQELSVKELKRDIFDAMYLLPETYRSILYLREMADFTYEELAQTLELTDNQVKVTLYRARQKFKKILSDRGLRDEYLDT